MFGVCTRVALSFALDVAFGFAAAAAGFFIDVPLPA